MLLLGRLGIRRNDLHMLKIRDIDLGPDEVHLRYAKGGEELPSPDRLPGSEGGSLPAHPAAAKDLLRHKSIATTEIYLHTWWTTFAGRSRDCLVRLRLGRGIEGAT